MVDYSPTLQAALDAASASEEEKTVFLPSGEYLISNQVNVPANVTLQGDGASTILIGDPEHDNILYSLLRIGGDNVTIEDLTLDGGGAPNITPIGIGYDTTIKSTTIQRVHLTRSTHDGIRSYVDVKSLTVVDCVFYNTPAGITLQPSGATSENIVLNNNRFMDFGTVDGGIGIQLYGGVAYDIFKNVQINGNQFFDLHENALPIEPTGCTDITVANNLLSGPGRRGISTGTSYGMLITGNRITGQSIYAIELNGGRDISIVGNMADGCTSFVQATGAPGNTTEDVLISNNMVRNNGYNPNGTSNAIYMRLGAKRWTISGNHFFNVKTSGQSADQNVIRIGTDSSTVGAVVTNNIYHCDKPDSVLTFVALSYGSQHIVKDNHVFIRRAVGAGANGISCIYARGIPDLIVQDNIIMVKGANTSTSFTGVGDADPGTYSAARVRVVDNIVRGFKSGYAVLMRNTAVDKVVTGNITT